jgi:hypothetical protein
MPLRRGELLHRGFAAGLAVGAGGVTIAAIAVAA